MEPENTTLEKENHRPKSKPSFSVSMLLWLALSSRESGLREVKRCRTHDAFISIFLFPTNNASEF